MGRLVKLCSMLTAILFAGTITVLGAVRLSYRDPFSPYQAIMPGQPIEAVKDYPCELHAGMVKGEEIGFCEFDVKDGVPGRVNLIENRHVITSLTFHVQANNLRLGDLILCWGDATLIVDDNPYEQNASPAMYWDNPFSVWVLAAPATSSSPFDYFRQISYVAFQGSASSCASA